jgi:hypothetical protein
MKLQKIGGFGSIGDAILLVIVLAIMLLVFPQLGLVGPSDWNDPVKGLDAGSASPITFFLFNLVMILVSIAVILIVLALQERMKVNAPNLMRIAVIGGSIACALWLSYGLIGIIGMPSIVSAKDASAFRAVMAIFSGLGTAGDFAMGWVLLLIGWAALRTGGLPRILSYFSVLRGVVMILEFVAQPLMVVGMLLGIVFYPWLGIVLLRSKS